MIIDRFQFKYCLQYTINDRTDIRETVLFVPHTRNYTGREKLSIFSLILGVSWVVITKWDLIYEKNRRFTHEYK